MSRATCAYDGVAILRPGRFTDAQGREVELSAGDLSRLAAEYDPAWHAAPLNLDHAEAGPSLGRVAGLHFDGEYLRADLAGVPDSLAHELSAGAYPGRSAELYPAREGRGPQLRALALLGARPPAVKGLPPLPSYRCETPVSSPDDTAPATAAGHPRRVLRLARRQSAPARNITYQGGRDGDATD